MSYFLSLRGSVPAMSTMAVSRGSFATSAGCMRSRSMVFQLRVEEADAPRLSFQVTVATVSLPMDSAISFTVSVVFNYLASMRYVFTHKQGLSRRREFVIFVVLSVIGLGVNDLLMWLGSSVLGVSYLIVKIVATAIVMVYNFVTRKIFLDGDTGAVLE